MNSIRFCILIIILRFVTADEEDVIHLNQAGYDEFLRLSEKIPTVPTIIYAFKVKKGYDSRFVHKTLKTQSRIKNQLKRFDLDADIFAINCLANVKPVCEENSNSEFYTYHITYNHQKLQIELNPNEKINERKLVKEILQFINPAFIDGCEDVVLNSIRYDSPLLQDDEQEVHWYKNRKRDCYHCPVDLKNVKILCGKTINSFLDQNSFSMVLFHLNIDINSRIALEKFINAASLRSDQIMGAVACNDWPDVCDKYNIVSWPEIWFFKNNQKYSLYQLPYDSFMIADSLDLMSRQPMTILSSKSDIEEFTKGLTVKLTSGKKIPALTVGFFASETDKEFIEFASVAEKMHDSYVFGSTFGDVAESWLKDYPFNTQIKLPTLITVKPAEELSPMVFYSHDTFQKQLIISFIQKASVPSLVELNTRSLPNLLKNNALLIIAIFPNGKDETFQHLTMLSKQIDTTKTRISYTDRTKDPVVTCKIVKSFRLNVSETPIIVGKQKDRIYFYDNKDLVDYEVNNIGRWIMEIQSNSIQPFIILNETETITDRPLAFNYLELSYRHQHRFDSYSRNYLPTDTLSMMTPDMENEVESRDMQRTKSDHYVQEHSVSRSVIKDEL